MSYDPEIHHRRSVRLRGYDYRQGGAYFVTLCTYERECLFGEVAEGAMRENRYGEVARFCWSAIPGHFPQVSLGPFVVMPNHVHGVIMIEDDGGRGTACRARTDVTCHAHTDAACYAPTDKALQACTVEGARFGKPASGALGVIVGSFKSAVSKQINALRDTAGATVWQRNYYEHIIRNDEEWFAIGEYIANNPAQWAVDRENPQAPQR